MELWNQPKVRKRNWEGHSKEQFKSGHEYFDELKHRWKTFCPKIKNVKKRKKRDKNKKTLTVTKRFDNRFDNRLYRVNGAWVIRVLLCAAVRAASEVVARQQGDNGVTTAAGASSSHQGRVLQHSQVSRVSFEYTHRTRALRKNFSSERVVKVWNSLAPSTVNFSSLTS